MAIFGVLTGLDHHGREQGHPRGRGPFGLGEALDEPAGLVTGDRFGRTAAHDLLQLAYDPLEIAVEGLHEGRRGHIKRVQKGCHTSRVPLSEA